MLEQLLVVSDEASMSGVMHEPRTAVMIVAEAMWQDPDGGVQTAAARVEDRSPGGACLRLRQPVVVGTRLVIHTRREQFSGAARYCRSEGRDYVVGIQRDKVMMPIPKETPADLPEQGPVESQVPPAESSSEVAIPVRARVEEVRPVPESDTRPTVIRPPEASEPAPCEVKIDHPPEVNATKVGKARRPMRNKLLELAHWRSKPDAPAENGNGNGNKQEAPHPLDPASFQIPIGTAASIEAELLSIEDIYHTAGIMTARHGIHRVVEMMHSEHLRGLSRDMKRAAVLMALDAAGIPADHVLRDCKVRQTALDAYEAVQKKQVEADCSRKAEENIQIQAELERVKTLYVARMSRNLESVEREKATFSHWLTTKQQESQNISDAADLLTQPAPPKAL